MEIDVNCVFEGRVPLGEGARIGANCVIANAEIAAGAVIHPFTHMDGEKLGVKIGEGALVGPFARLRPGADLGPEVHVGNFVEVKNSTLARGAKANHLAYLGDATVGERVNYGAGSITANYDGANKHRTVIEDDVHVGSNCVLVAPVTMGRGGTVGGGSHHHQGRAGRQADGGARQQVCSNLAAAERKAESRSPSWHHALSAVRASTNASWRGRKGSRPACWCTGGHRPRARIPAALYRAAAPLRAPASDACYVLSALAPAGLAVEFAALDREERLHVAHVRVAGEQPLRQRQVARHVARLDHQDEVRPGRNAVALLHRFARPATRASKASCCSAALAVQRDLHHGLQPCPSTGASRSALTARRPAARSSPHRAAA